ncbi:MAG TPA: hypothetical protein VK029_08905 [Pseudogracilibacillus sp.]|nr:hypothetical protein [Pseudogracilibacillus sp.]
MRKYALLRLLLSLYLLYFAWPYVPYATTQLEKLFWLSWLAFVTVVIGANLLTLLKLSLPPVMEQASSYTIEERQRARQR